MFLSNNLPPRLGGPHVKLKTTGDEADAAAQHDFQLLGNRVIHLEMPDPLCAWIIISVRFHHIYYSGWNVSFPI